MGGLIITCIVIAAAISLVIAIVAGAIDKSKMITVAKASEASNYIDGELDLSAKKDVFCYSTESVIHHETHDNNPTFTSGGHGGFAGQGKPW